MNRQPLKGLLLFVIFNFRAYLIMASIFMLGASILLIAVGTTPMTALIAMFIFPIMSLVNNASEVKADKGKWDKFQLSMPIKRRDVITSKYLSYLFLMLLALVVTGIVEGIAQLLDVLNVLQVGRFMVGIEGIIEMVDALAVTTGQLSVGIILISMGSAFLTCGFHYPLNFTIFRKMEELTALISLLGNIAMTVFLIWLGGRLELSLNQLVLLGFFVPALLFILSYFFTVHVYKKIDV